jgi:hypothetical protein
MKKIYIILAHTGTILSTIIRYWTKDEFSHVSIALDAELEQMYSFGRLNPYNPFWGSFVHEHINKGTFKRFKKAKAEVYSLFVTDEQYEKAKKTKRITDEKLLNLFISTVHKDDFLGLNRDISDLLSNNYYLRKKEIFNDKNNNEVTQVNVHDI